jgi:hypothetical protein
LTLRRSSVSAALFAVVLLLSAVLTALAVTAPTADAKTTRVFGERPLRPGMFDRDVRVLQDFLTRVGVTTPVDGHYGPYTESRVRVWERRNNRRVDGRISLKDARVLRRQVEDATGTGATDLTTLSALAPGEKATIGPDGLAVPPASAPEPVKRIIAAANEIHDKPYKYGGGHARWDDSGYDCSGSVSFALHGAGLLRTALDSTGFMSWGQAGKGRWVTIYAHGGHAYMVVAGLRFDTSGRAERGSRWTKEMRSSDGFTVRHPAGL